MKNKVEHETSGIGALMLLIGWIIGLALLGFLIHQVFFAPKDIDINRTVAGTTITIYRDADQHFRIDGNIDGATANFLIDTGATFIAIPESIAKQARLKKGRAVNARTAGGISKAYYTKIKMLQLGPYKFKNVSAMILTELGNECLLGMNILKRFESRQDGEKLELTLSIR